MGISLYMLGPFGFGLLCTPYIGRIAFSFKLKNNKGRNKKGRSL
jgi:hypothetical protein